ncbi:MAG: ComEC/Rec2 family competence protein [Pseudolabrys sp.]
MANLLAMFVVSVAVMPIGILGVVAMPFGFDGVFWHLMGGGIDWMVWVAKWVGSLPGAVGRIQAFGTGPLLVGTAGMLLICLLRTPLRLSGAALVLGVSLWAITSPRPDVLVADDGQTVAIRGPDGRLSVLRSSRDTFAVKEWLAAGADARTPKDASLNTGVTCDAIGCIGRLADGRLASMALEVEAFAEDCARAAVVVSARGAPSSSCAATLVDRGVWRTHGAIASGAANTSSKASHFPSGYQRPWTRVMVSAVAVGQGANQPAPRDASPRSEFLEADD